MARTDLPEVVDERGTPARRVWVLTAVLAVAAVALYAAASRHLGHEVDAHYRISPWALVALFVVGEVCVVHYVFRRESYTFSLSEVPLVLGLFLASPAGLVGAQFVGAAAALVLHRRQSPLKLCFNLAHMALATTAALVVFHAVDHGRDPLAPWAVVAMLAATAAAVVVAAVAISAAISLYEGRPDARKLAGSIGANFVVGVTNACIGLVAVVLLQLDSAALWLLVVPLALLLFAYRSLTLSLEKQEGLEFLYEASRVLHRGGSLEEPMVELLALARETFHAERAELTLATGDGTRGLRTAVAADERVSRLEPTALAPVPSGPTVMAADLEGEHRRLGMLVVAGPSDAQGHFSKRQQRLFETFANHVAVALENGLLETSVEQLTALKEELHFRAFHDNLTGLGNRALFVSELERAVAGRAPGQSVTVLFVDLDDFKTVNDSLGHAAGDELLARTANGCAGACVRATWRPASEATSSPCSWQAHAQATKPSPCRSPSGSSTPSASR